MIVNGFRSTQQHQKYIFIIFTSVFFFIIMKTFAVVPPPIPTVPASNKPIAPTLFVPGTADTHTTVSMSSPRGSPITSSPFPSAASPSPPPATSSPSSQLSPHAPVYRRVSLAFSRFSLHRNDNTLPPRGRDGEDGEDREHEASVLEKNRNRVSIFSTRIQHFEERLAKDDSLTPETRSMLEKSLERFRNLKARRKSKI